MVRAFAGDLDRLADVVELAQTDLLVAQRAGVLELAQVQRQQHALAQLEGHVGQLGLGELEARERLVEDACAVDIAPGRLEAVAGRTQRAPRRCRSGPR
jgi:hypothetical protein